MTATRSSMDIYGGKKPADVPAYFFSEAAHHLRLPAATVRAWVVGQTYPTKSGPRQFRPIIRIADPRKRFLSFCNLVELHVLSSMRREHKVKLRAVRNAISYLQQQFHSEHPLLDEQMQTDGKDLFIERYGELVNISDQGQMAMKRILEIYLTRIDRDARGVPIRLFPFSRRSIADSPKFISIDPKIQFGKPCIAGTRVPTSIVAERHEAGDSVAVLAEDYGRSTEEIEEAIRYESRRAS